MISAYELHPIAVHFPIALAFGGLFLKSLSAGRRHSGLEPGVLWISRIVAPLAVTAAALGLFAMRRAPHVPSAWETMADHKTLGLWAAGTCVLLWLSEEASRRRVGWFTWINWTVWLLATGLLLAAGSLGGKLVFHYGVGVATAPHL